MDMLEEVYERLPGFYAMCHMVCGTIVIDHRSFQETAHDLMLLGAAVKYANSCGKRIEVVGSEDLFVTISQAS